MLTKTKWLCIAAIWLCLQSNQNVFAQSENENAEKYWNYRDRFRKWFVKIGDDAGEGIQMMELNSKGGDQFDLNCLFNTGSIKTADAPANMGDYMAIKITTKNNFQQTHTTLNQTHYIYNTKKQPT